MVQDNASRSANEDPQLAALRKLYNSQVDPVKKLEIQEMIDARLEELGQEK